MPPPPIPRQQRRKIRRACLERGAKWMQRGLPDQLTDDDALGLALTLHARLTDTANPTRAADTAGDAEALLSRSIDSALSGITVGCHKGCSYCCGFIVTVSAPEAFRVARWFRDHAGGAADAIPPERVAEVAAFRHALPDKDVFTRRTPCPMLLAGACGIYEARPLACRALHSMSSQACRDAIENDKGGVPLFTPTMDRGEIVRTLLLAAVSAAGLSDRGYELTAAVELALHSETSEARWLAGEDVFAGIRSGPRLASARGGQDRLAEMIRTLAG